MLTRYQQSQGFFRGLLLLAWMIVIYVLSSIPGSGSNYEPPLWYVIERKSAHVLEFAILTVLMFRFLRVWFRKKTQVKHMIAVSWMFAFSYGALDELHQAFVFGRGSHFSDVCVDVVGASIASLMLTLVLKVSRLKKLQKVLY